MKQQISLSVLAHAIAQKTARKGVKVLVNGRPISLTDLRLLLDRVAEGKEHLVSAHQDASDRWHIETL